LPSKPPLPGVPPLPGTPPLPGIPPLPVAVPDDELHPNISVAKPRIAASDEVLLDVFRPKAFRVRMISSVCGRRESQRFCEQCLAN
jgi:hypothetical protein